MGYSPWGHKESDTTPVIHFTSVLLMYICVVSDLMSLQTMQQCVFIFGHIYE